MAWERRLWAEEAEWGRHGDSHRGMQRLWEVVSGVRMA
jgi:hypothetical protein